MSNLALAASAAVILILVVLMAFRSDIQAWWEKTPSRTRTIVYGVGAGILGLGLLSAASYGAYSTYLKGYETEWAEIQAYRGFSKGSLKEKAARKRMLAQEQQLADRLSRLLRKDDKLRADLGDARECATRYQTLDALLEKTKEIKAKEEKLYAIVDEFRGLVPQVDEITSELAKAMPEYVDLVNKDPTTPEEDRRLGELEAERKALLQRLIPLGETHLRSLQAVSPIEWSPPIWPMFGMYYDRLQLFVPARENATVVQKLFEIDGDYKRDFVERLRRARGGIVGKMKTEKVRMKLAFSELATSIRRPKEINAKRTLDETRQALAEKGVALPDRSGLEAEYRERVASRLRAIRAELPEPLRDIITEDYLVEELSGSERAAKERELAENAKNILPQFAEIPPPPPLYAGDQLNSTAEEIKHAIRKPFAFGYI